MTISGTSRELPLFDWILRETDPNEAHLKSLSLAEQFGCPPLVARLLLARGIDTSEKAREYLNPSRDSILSPEAIPGSGEAVTRISKAIKNKEQVLVHGDYDVDGIVGAVMLHQTLRNLGCQSRIFLPCRNRHGFGLALEAVEKAMKTGISLIVSVDCGISSKESVKAARDAGIEVIITDHHAIPEDLPQDAILVHPELEGEYPGGKIAGATVAYKLALGLLGSLGHDLDDIEERYLPLVAMATVADVCPLTGENRAIVSLGLEGISSSKIPGLEVLFKGTRRNDNNEPVNARDIAFGMAPCINAAGRMGDPLPAARLLLAKDNDTAWKHFRLLERLNRERKRIQGEVIRRLMKLPEVARETGGIIALVDQDCTPGLAGLAAARLTEQTGRPACVLAPGEDEKGPLYRGSMRTFGSDNLLDLMEPVTEFVDRLGGHPGALGLTVRPEKLDEFMGACRQIEWTPKRRELHLDFILDQPPKNEAQVTELDMTRPWGEGNPQPGFIWEPVEIEKTRAVGKELEHIQVELHGGSGSVVKGIGFSLARYLNDKAIIGRSGRAAGHFILNEWRGSKSVEFQLTDMELL